MGKRLIYFSLLLCMALISACSSLSIRDPKDPWEGFNRQIFRFNETCDKVVLRPVAKIYDGTAPVFVRKGVSNFYANLRAVPVATNKLLQGDIVAAIEGLMRFMINLTFGLGGVNDIATQVDLPQHESDFGLTLAKWGMPSGPYLMLPLLGASTLRDTVGLFPEWFFASPTSYLRNTFFKVTLFGIFVVDARANLLNASDLLSKVAFDKYIFLREAYLQRRGELAASLTRKMDRFQGKEGGSNDFDENSDPYIEDSL